MKRQNQVERRKQVVEENEKALALLYKHSPEPFDLSWKNTVWTQDCRRLNVVLPKRAPFPSTIIQVWNLDTLDAAFRLKAQNERPLVLNMASDFRPGGGYLKGSMAQEEELFRRTSLSWNLDPARYPLGPFECCYSPNVYVFRNGPETSYDRCRGWEVDILSIAAVRKPRLLKDKYANPLDELAMLEKIRGMFKVAIANKHECLLLSAFGCGAFYNPPHAVAGLFNQVCKEFDGHVKLVVFSILPGPNYDVFRDVLVKG